MKHNPMIGKHVHNNRESKEGQVFRFMREARKLSLKDVAENRAVGDATTLADPNVMKLIAEGLQSATSED